MKEIDLLPEWYKSGRRRQISYRTQYFVLGGVFAVMLVWNFVTSYSISQANAQVKEMTTQRKQAERVSAKLVELKHDMNLFHNRELLVEKIDSRINVASILAELSYLIDERVVLSKIDLISEKFKYTQDKESSRTGAAIRSVKSAFGQKQDQPLGDVRFKALLAGVAADASDVAALICKLENSPYFCHVVLSFSRNVDLERASGDLSNLRTETITESPNTIRGAGGSRGNIQVSKFEISCYLANYREQ